jgi:hypothetical protein
MQRFEARLGVGNLVQIVGNVVARPVVLVVPAAALLHDARLARRAC